MITFTGWDTGLLMHCGECGLTRNVCRDGTKARTLIDLSAFAEVHGLWHKGHDEHAPKGPHLDSGGAMFTVIHCICGWSTRYAETREAAEAYYAGHLAGDES